MAKEEESGELLRWLKKQSSVGSAPQLKTDDLQTSLTNVAKSLDPFAAAIKNIPGPGNLLYNTLTNANAVFTDLSKTGGGFRGDLIALASAAGNARISMSEFAGILKENNEVFIGLGGTVTRGQEAFAKLSKAFLDDRSADNLRLLGYSAKDLNELMAVQAVTLRGNFKDETERNRIATENAAKLGIEMDLMARLTGKSREQQLEQMKKAQADMQFEAAIRLKTQGMNAEEAAKFEANARSQYRDAELRGQGQMFKEIFATGQIMSKEAATQASLNQEQAAATRKQAQISADRSLDSAKREEEATKAGREARAAATADMNNTSKLQLMALGEAGGEASKALNQSAGAQISYTRGLEAIAKANNLDLKNKDDLAKAQKIQEEQALKEAAGRDDNGKTVNELNKSMILMDARARDVAAALNESMITPLRNLDGPLANFNKGLSEAGRNFGGTGQNVRAAMADATEKGRTGKPLGEVSGLGGDVLKAMHVGASVIEQATKKGAEYIEKAGNYFSDVTKDGVGKMLENLGKTVGEVAPRIKEGADKAKESIEGPLKLIHQYIIEPLAKAAAQQVPKRQGGSVQMTGNLFEDWGKGTLVELHGLEGVVRPEEMTNIAKGMTNQGAAKAIDNLKNQISNMPKDAAKGIDLGSISKDISTTVSAPTPKTPQTIELKQPTAPSKVEVINWPKDFGKPNVTPTPASAPAPKKEEAAKPVEAAKPTPTQASVRAVDNKIEEAAKPTPTQASVRAVDNALDIPKPDLKALTSEFGEEMKLPFGSMMDEFGSSFEKTYNDIQSTMGKVDLSNFNIKLEEINKDLVESLPVIEIQKSSEEISGSARRFSQSYKEAMNSSVESNEEHLAYLNEKEQKRLEREKTTLGEIEQLEAKAQEQQLTYEEQLQLESLKHRIDVLKTNEEYNKAEIDATKKALNDQLELAEGIQGQIVGVTEKTNISQLDSVTQAKDAMMLEANEIASEITDLIPTDSVIAAKDAMMLEANEIAEDIAGEMSAVDIPPIQVEDVLVQARDNFMLEANEIAEDINNITKSIPAATTTLSDMTMAADEIASEMADLIPTDSVIAAKDAMMLEANNIAEDIESVMSGIEFKPIEIDDLIGDTDYISSSIKNALPFDEFAGVDKAINEQEKMLLFADDMRGGLDEVAHDIQANLGSMLDEYQQPEEEDTDYISSAIKNALPFDEFAGVDKAINEQEKMLLFADDMRGGLDEVVGDIQANLGSMIDKHLPKEEEDTDYISSAIKNALPFDEFAGLDKAIELQKNIQKNTSGMDVLAEDGSVAQGIKINPETGERYYTDIPEESKKSLDSQLKTTNPFFNEKGELDLNTIHLPGMKKYGADLKSQTQSISKKEENESSAETARLKRQAEKKSDSETSNNESKTSESKSTATVTKDATLNDVVKQLSSLNKNMQNLIDQNQKLLGDQLRAVKANNKNNFVGVY